MEQHSEVYSDVSSRYASALISLASQEKCIKEVEQDFSFIFNLDGENKLITKNFENPTISKKDKLNIIDEIIKSHKFNEYTLNFLKLLIESGRISYFSNILKSFKKIISNRKGEISAEIETAEALPEKDKTSIKNDLQISYKANINAEFKINKKLISGSRIKIGSLMVDNSLQSKLYKILKGV